MFAKPVSLLRWFAVALALALLAATLAWHIPFMLWDHLDFAPLYASWRNGMPLSQTIFWRNHGGHLHTAAYAVLFVTTWLSDGQTWLDCLVSWALLCGYALVIVMICRATLRFDDGRTCAAAALILFLALYPGHLANLQWGWQIAVFLCLFGTVVAIRSLTLEHFGWKDNAIALLGAALALLSFGTALALVPIALLAIAMRSELSIVRRVGLGVPWLLGSPIVMYALRSDTGLVTRYVGVDASSLAAGLFQLAHYTLNFLGSGVARFATGAAPWLALLAIVGGGIVIVAARGRREMWPWIALMLFGVFSAVLTAFGRVDEGAAQAFASRYVSFSTVFWIGWIGLIAMATPAAVRKPAAWFAFGLVAVFAVINAAEMSESAERLARDSRVTAATVCATYPNLDRGMLENMHYAGADVARQRLQVVHELGFAPFDDCVPKTGEAR